VHCLERSGEFDLVHNHLDWLPLAMSRLCRTPMLTTIHGFGDRRILPAYQRSTSSFVAISDADRAPELVYVATVHHGVDLSQWPVDLAPGESLVVFGRIHPDKATADATEIARRAGRRLIICGLIVVDRRQHVGGWCPPDPRRDRADIRGGQAVPDRAHRGGAASASVRGCGRAGSPWMDAPRHARASGPARPVVIGGIALALEEPRSCFVSHTDHMNVPRKRGRRVIRGEGVASVEHLLVGGWWSLTAENSHGAAAAPARGLRPPAVGLGRATSCC
jgi:hypothetical protein